MGFQTAVSLYPAPGIVGEQASMNPVRTVDVGSGALVAASGGVTVGNFAWISGTTNLGGGTASNVFPSLGTAAPTAPDGLVLNSHEALITTWLGQASMVIPQGVGLTLADRGDFWNNSNYAAATRGQKVFANFFNGDVLVAAAGSFPANLTGTNASVTATCATNVLTVTAVASGVLAVGQLVQGVGIPPNTYILSLGTGTGGTGTYNLTTTPGTLPSSTFTLTSVAGQGGCVCSSVSSSSSTTMTINTITSGTLAVGMLVQGITSVPAGTYIASFGTFNGTSGTIILSQATTGTITAQACNFSPFIETPWYALSDGNPGDLIKIGVKN
jgi:hypothetical protein